MAKAKSAVGQAIAAGRERVANAIATAETIPAKSADKLTFVTNFKKLINPWMTFIAKLESLKPGECIALDLGAPPVALAKAAATCEVELEYALVAGALHVRIAAAGIDEDLA